MQTCVCHLFICVHLHLYLNAQKIPSMCVYTHSIMYLCKDIYSQRVLLGLSSSP